MKPVAVGIDVGSSGCKITATDRDGHVVAKGYQGYETSYPSPGWAEQNPEDWEVAVRIAFSALLSSGSVSASDVACVAISSATHTLVCVGRDGRVLRPAILWTDKRTIAEVEWLRAEYGALIIEETLHAPNVNWTLPYLIWIRKHESHVWSRIDTILMPKDYLRMRLTGHRATDWMDAHGTLLFNVPQRRWSERICKALGIPMRVLPEVLPPTHPIGKITKKASEEFGLPEGVPVIVGTTDQACEAFGTGTIREGSGLIKLATAGNVGVVTEHAHPDPPHVYAYYHLKSGLWYTLSGTSSCAVCYRWIHDLLFENGSRATGSEEDSIYKKMDRVASTIPVGSEGLIFHPYFQGSLSDPYLRADFLGLTLRHGRGHVLRATLEGVAFSLYECLLKEEKVGVTSVDFRIIGGGSKSPLWRRIICDVFGREMIRVEEDDSSFGTALLAGVGIGFFQGIDDAVRRCVKTVEKISPNSENHKIYRKYFEYYLESQAALKPPYHSLYRLVL